MHATPGNRFDITLYLPTVDEQIAFYKTVDRKVLMEIYEIKDSLTIHFRSEDVTRKISAAESGKIRCPLIHLQGI
jgi:hypothetical protein